MQQSRDPRFNNLTGELKEDGFQAAYSFLPEMHVEELATLKENLSRARKLLANSPKHLREERAEEVQRLDFAVRRLESTVQREHRQKIEQDALDSAKKAEKEKQQYGKGQWFMKDCASNHISSAVRADLLSLAEKKGLLLKARYDDLAASGKRGAVQKAIDKKHRKVAQKEKKSRPFPAPSRSGGEARTSDSASRSRSADSRPNKRQKFT